MRGPDGRLKILDFGLARVDGGDAGAPRVTQPGLLVGTPAYMAPEQINGMPVDARADVFAVGVLLHEYACGVHPFTAPTALATVARVLESDARSLATVANVPSRLADVIAKCLQKAPEQRFGSAAELLGALDVAGFERPAPTPHAAWWRIHQIVDHPAVCDRCDAGVADEGVGRDTGDRRRLSRAWRGRNHCRRAARAPRLHRADEPQPAHDRASSRRGRRRG